MVEWSTGMGHVCPREQWGARAADPQALCQRVHAAVKNAQVALKRPGGQMHQGQCGHRSTAKHAAVPARRMPPFLWWRPGSNPGCIGQGQFECARVGQGLPVSGCPAENQRSTPGEPACFAIADASPARPNPCKGAQQPRMRGLPSDRSSTTRMRCKAAPTARSSG